MAEKDKKSSYFFDKLTEVFHSKDEPNDNVLKENSTKGNFIESIKESFWVVKMKAIIGWLSFLNYSLIYYR